MMHQAHLSHTQDKKASGCRAVAFKLQDALHGGESLLLPGFLVLAATSCVVHEHVTKSMGSQLGIGEENSVRNFLTFIVLSMLPLAFLEKVIFAVPNPLDVMSKMSGKILLSHACFLTLRTIMAYNSEHMQGKFFCAACSLVVSCTLCFTVFRMRSFQTLFADNCDVWYIVLFGLGVAVLTGGGVEAGSNNLELLAFVPAILFVHRVGNDSRALAQQTGGVADTRQRAFALFAFLVCFYCEEDMLSAIDLGWEMPLAAIGHIVHFLLLLDFAGYLLSHLYDPKKMEKLAGALWDMFAVSMAV